MYFDYIENNNEIEKEDDKIMSKELNIIEAMKMPLDTLFDVVFSDGYNNQFDNKAVLTDKEEIKWIDNEGNTHETCGDKLFINAKFIPIQKSVTFMEAITQNHYNDKTIRCEVDDKVYTYKPVQTKTTEIRAIETRGGISTEEILNGKWYIEEN